MGTLGLPGCLLNNGTPRLVTMETTSTQQSVMGTGFPALSGDFPLWQAGGQHGTPCVAGGPGHFSFPAMNRCLYPTLRGPRACGDPLQPREAKAVVLGLRRGSGGQT